MTKVGSYDALVISDIGDVDGAAPVLERRHRSIRRLLQHKPRLCHRCCRAHRYLDRLYQAELL